MLEIVICIVIRKDCLKQLLKTVLGKKIMLKQN